MSYDYKAKMDYWPSTDENILILFPRRYDGQRFNLTLNIEELAWAQSSKPIIDPFNKEGIQTEKVIQSIIDAAWEFGMRPSGYKAEGEIAAIKGHLEDMRKIVFLKVK
jgi:hypothetical protein